MSVNDWVEYDCVCAIVFVAERQQLIAICVEIASEARLVCMQRVVVGML